MLRFLRVIQVSLLVSICYFPHFDFIASQYGHFESREVDGRRDEIQRDGPMTVRLGGYFSGESEEENHAAHLRSQGNKILG